jgi:uncharacterized protein YdaU (DUF1376 family)
MKWYKRDPEAFAGGTAELSLEEVGAYTRIIDLIYSRDGNGPNFRRTYRELTGNFRDKLRTSPDEKRPKT